MKSSAFFSVLTATAVLLIGCGQEKRDSLSGVREVSPQAAGILAEQAAFDPMEFILSPHLGGEGSDGEIQRWQTRARQSTNDVAVLSRLGWAFVARARVSFQPEFYRLALMTADAIARVNPADPDGLLLRGHVLQSTHQFREAEEVARRLVTARGLAVDHGLLGDVLLDRGQVDEAIPAYQAMLDLRPDLHGYTRAAQARWLKGDVRGALDLTQLAMGAVSPRVPEPAAWVATRLAQLRFQLADFVGAEQAVNEALGLLGDYAPALVMRGKLLLQRAETPEAIAAFRVAAVANPLPETEWLLADALREAHMEAEAAKVEEDLRRHGAALDPRGYSLFLATRGESAERAIRLAAAELEERKDIFTHDALAWAYFAAGRMDEASGEMELALREGTQDARLFLHASLIAGGAGRRLEAERYATRAMELVHLLLPSERDRLLKEPTQSPILSANGQ